MEKKNESTEPVPPDDEAEEEEEAQSEDADIFRWWCVTREAQTSGRLLNFVVKGKARRNSSRTVSFDWSFQPANSTAATQSPEFRWLDMSWGIRFQKSPFESGILHQPAWSIFLDLFPPYEKIHRVSGTFCLVDGESLIGLWKLDEDFQPASQEQEICTWCRKRLNLDKYVNQMKGKDIVLRVKLTAWGLGKEWFVEPMKTELESLPFTLKVGTTTVAKRFGWDLRKHLKSLPEDQIQFWKKLRDDPRGRKKIKFTPRDIVAAVQNAHMVGMATWKACSELKKFFVEAIHLATEGVAFIPYHLVFFDFDLMDGSDAEDDPRKESWQIGYVSGEKHSLIVRVLDMLAEGPLTAAFERASGKEGPHSFSTIQFRERQAEEVRASEEEVVCSACGKSGLRKDLFKCSLCLTQHYCNRTCQRSHWKKHKRECKQLEKGRKAREKAEKVNQADTEEKKAGDLMDQLMEDQFRGMFNTFNNNMFEGGGVDNPFNFNGSDE